MDYRRAGSFRQRARNSERTTRQLREHRRQHVSVRTHEAIQEFEEHLKTVQDSGAIDDLPMDADAGHLRDHSRRSMNDRYTASSSAPRDNSSDTSSAANRTNGLARSQSEMHSRTAGSGGPDVDARYDKRPPSPLAFYDYGGISTKPRSVLAQHSKETGESARPLFRQSSCGFYFPGAEFRQGPYGFSMMDPIHMPPRGWDTSKQTPARWPRDTGDVRPATTEGKEHRHRRSRTAGPVISDMVRSNTAHDRRAALAFRSVDKKNEEAQIENVRFEQGVFEGRWRDPLLDPAIAAPALGPAQPVRCGFLAEVGEDAPRVQKVASEVLFGVEEALRTSRGNLQNLFRAVNRGTVGVLEPAEFLEGIIRLGIAREGQFTVGEIIQAMALIDPNFDGRINFPALERTVAAARGVQRQQVEEAKRLAQQHENKVTHSYGEALPIEIVKVERQPKSLFDFERAFERFRKQQKELLAHHGELMH